MTLLFFMVGTVDAYRADGLFSYKESIVFDYYNDFRDNGYKPYVGERDHYINPDYPSVHLYIDDADLPYFLEKKNGDKDLNVIGYLKPSTSESILTTVSEFIVDSVTLRGNMSMSCAKPSFSLPDTKLKLKGMC